MTTAQKDLDLSAVWRVIEKFKEAVMRLGLNLYEQFQRFDPTGEQLISEYLFRKVLQVCLKNEVALSEDEVRILTNYFQYRDGRIMYSELCDRVHDKIIEFSTNIKKNLITGLEWEDPLHINALKPDEENKLIILLNSIAQVLIHLDHPIDVHFKEYEQITRNPGCVSINHLGRIFRNLSIRLTQDDFNLLIKRYSRHNFMFNYIPFLDELNAAIKCVVMSQNSKIDIRYILNTECEKIKRPDLYFPKATERGKEWGMPVSFRLLNSQKSTEEGPLLTIRRIKHHIFTNGIDMDAIFADLDKYKTGLVTSNNFIRALTNCGINSGINTKLGIKVEDINALIQIYLKPYDNNKWIMWKLFVNDMYNGLIKKNEITNENYEDNSDLKFIPFQGNKWDVTPEDERLKCEETLEKIRTYLIGRRWTLVPFFKEWDKTNRGYVNINIFRNVLTSNNVISDPKELDALEKRYTDVNGFNYNLFIKEVRHDLLKDNSIKSSKKSSNKNEINMKTSVDPCYKKEFSNIEISDAIRNIRRQVVVLSRKLDDYFKQFDPLNKNQVTKNEFLRVLGSNNIEFTNEEGEILTTVFKSPLDERIDFGRFMDVINEAYTQKNLDKSPMIVPIKHIPVIDTPDTFLNMKERQQVESALDKLSNKLSMINYDEIKCFDHAKAGDLTDNEFIKFLDYCKINLTRNEIMSLNKAYGRSKGGVKYLEYLPILKTCDILYKQKKYQ